MFFALMMLMGGDVECEQDYGDFYGGMGDYFYDDYDDDYYFFAATRLHRIWYRRFKRDM